MTSPPTPCPRSRRQSNAFTPGLVRTQALAVLLAMAAAAPTAANATVFNIQYDLVKVSTVTDATGTATLSAAAIGPGPFEAHNGAGPIVFATIDNSGNETDLNGFTTAQVPSNFLQPRYFGSDAAPNGGFFENASTFAVNPDLTISPTQPVNFAGFTIFVTHRGVDSIGVALGGQAFDQVTLAPDGSSVTFLGADIPPALFPDPGIYLWSSITPQAPQPPFPDSLFVLADPNNPPTGPFADTQLGGVTLPVPEPNSAGLILAGLASLAFAGVRGAKAKRQAPPPRSPSPRSI